MDLTQKIKDYGRITGMYVLLAATAFGADPVKVNSLADCLRPSQANGTYTDSVTGKQYPSRRTTVLPPNITNYTITVADFMLAEVDGIERFILTVPVSSGSPRSISLIRFEIDSENKRYGPTINRIYLNDGNSAIPLIRGDGNFETFEKLFDLILEKKDGELKRQNPGQPDKK